MKKRLFVAIDFPPQIKKQIASLIQKLKSKYPQIRWEKKENLHLTLKFLGWVGDKLKIKPFGSAQGESEKLKVTHSVNSGQAEKNEKIREILKGMARATKDMGPFWFRPTKIGYFLRESLIIWLGAEGQEGLLRLVENLEKEMEKLGFPKENRPFAAHITLGRLRHARPINIWRQIAQELENFKTPDFEKFKVEKITLMESHLTPQGSIYKTVEVGHLPA